MKVKDLTDNYGGPIFFIGSKRQNASLLEQDIKKGDRVLFECLKNGVKRYVRITGNTPTSWAIEEEKPESLFESEIF